MTKNEEFEKWAVSRGCDVSMTDCNNPIYMSRDVQGCWLTWQARQPEIDALKAEVGEREKEISRLSPAQEAEPVASLTISHFRGHLENREIDYYGDLPDGTYKLYTRPQSSSLRKAAEELSRYMKNPPEGIHRVDEYMPLVEKLAAALDGKS